MTPPPPGFADLSDPAVYNDLLREVGIEMQPAVPMDLTDEQRDALVAALSDEIEGTLAAMQRALRMLWGPAPVFPWRISGKQLRARLKYGGRKGRSARLRLEGRRRTRGSWSAVVASSVTAHS
jgi:hypothetical protein